MTIEVLRYHLSSFLNNGYLKEIYADNEKAFFSFLDKVYVGFYLWPPRPCEPQEFINHLVSNKVEGLLLTCFDVEVFAHYISPFKEVYNIYLNDNTLSQHSLVFDEKLFKQCQSGLGRFKIKRKINRMQHKHCVVYSREELLPVLNNLHIAYAKAKENAITNHTFRSKYTPLYKKFLRKFNCILGVGLLGFIVVLTCLFAMPFTKKYDTPVSYIEFNKNSDVHADVKTEIDFLVPYATKSYISTNADSDFYLFANSKTGYYGIAEFYSTTNINNLIENTKNGVLSEPVYIYGDSWIMDSDVKAIANNYNKKESDKTQENGKYITLLDGTKIWIPDSLPHYPPEISVSNYMGASINDYSKDAIKSYNQLISKALPNNIGNCYIGMADTEISYIQAPINKNLENICVTAASISILSGGVILMWVFFNSFRSYSNKRIEEELKVINSASITKSAKKKRKH